MQFLVVYKKIVGMCISGIYYLECILKYRLFKYYFKYYFDVILTLLRGYLGKL